MILEQVTHSVYKALTRGYRVTDVEKNVPVWH